jgi:hypothetical protein
MNQDSNVSAKMAAAMTKVAVATLIGRPLDWAVARCERMDTAITPSLSGGWNSVADGFRPSTDPAWGHPIIDREGIATRKHKKSGVWYALALDDAGDNQQMDWVEFTARGGQRYGAASYQVHKRQQRFEGPTSLVAAMRCHVARNLGAEIDVPSVLLPH